MLGAILKRWNWLDEGLIPLAGALMTASWGYPLFATFLRDPKTGALAAGYSFWLCMSVLLIGYLVGRMASENRMAIVIIVVGGMAAILIMLLIVIPAYGEPLDQWFVHLFRFVERGETLGEVLPAPLVVIVLTVVLWARGVRLAGIERAGAVAAFVVGMIAIAGLLFLASVLPADGTEVLKISPKLYENLSSGIIPLFLIALPATVGFALIAPAFGRWASIASEISLVLGILFISFAMPYGPSASSLLGWLVLFLSSGLATLALISISTTLREQERMTGVKLQIDRYWLTIMVVIVVVVIVTGLVIGQLVAPESVLALLGILRPVWRLIRDVFLIVLFVFAYLFFSLIEPLLADLESRPEQIPSTFMSPVQAESIEDLVEQAAEIPPVFSIILQIILIAGAVGVIALLFYLAFRRRERRALVLGDDVLETRENVLSLDLLQEQLKGLFDGLRRRRASMFADLGEPNDPRVAIREMYQKILAHAIVRKRPRGKQQTPHTYRPALSSLHPGRTAAIETLTRLYALARYGREPPTAEQLAEARDAFTSLQPDLEQDNESQ